MSRTRRGSVINGVQADRVDWWRNIRVVGMCLPLAMAGPAALAFAGKNLGLVGVAEIAPDAMDQRSETLGGFFSGMCWDPDTRTLIGLVDRGPLDGKVDYRPRVQLFDFAIDLAGTNLHNITLTHKATVLLRDDAGNVFSGAGANDTASTNFPKVAGGPRAIDPEAIARASDGTFWIGDEYGPFIYHFDSTFKMLSAIVPPAHVWPQSGPAGALKTNFTSMSQPVSGREKNHGFEGVGLSPDGNMLFAMLQGPLVQDKTSRNARLFTWDIGSGREPRLSGEYVYPLDGLPSGKKTALQSEILVINADSLLVLERDDNGLSSSKEKQICGIYLATLRGTAISKTLLVDLLDRAELAQAGFTDLGRLPQKWEGMAIVEHPSLPPHQYLLLVGVDNDFKTQHGFFKTAAHEEGVPTKVVDSAEQEVPTLLLAYRIELPVYKPQVNHGGLP